MSFFDSADVKSLRSALAASVFPAHLLLHRPDATAAAVPPSAPAPNSRFSSRQSPTDLLVPTSPSHLSDRFVSSHKPLLPLFSSR
jgi:hypothetical protein